MFIQFYNTIKVNAKSCCNAFKFSCKMQAWIQKVHKPRLLLSLGALQVIANEVVKTTSKALSPQSKLTLVTTSQIPDFGHCQLKLSVKLSHNQAINFE